MNESPDKIIICSTKVLRDLSKYLSSVGSLHLNESKSIKNNYQINIIFLYVFTYRQSYVQKLSYHKYIQYEKCQKLDLLYYL